MPCEEMESDSDPLGSGTVLDYTCENLLTINNYLLLLI